MTNFESPSKRFEDAIADIDKAMPDVQKAKEKLLVSEKQLTGANSRLEHRTVKKRTRKNPTMKAKFDELKGDE